MGFRRVILGLDMDMFEVPDVEPAQAPFRSNTLSTSPISVKLNEGTTDGKANRGYLRKETLTPGQTVTRTLAGSLADRDGTTINLDVLDYLVLINTNTAGTVSIGPGAAANPIAGYFAGTAPLAIAGAALNAKDPGWVAFRHPKGAAVAAGASDEVQIINNDGSNSAIIYWGFVGRDTP